MLIHTTRRSAVAVGAVATVATMAFAGTMLACVPGGPNELKGPALEGTPGSSSERPAITAASTLALPSGAVTTVATGLRIPWGIAFLPDGTALVTERGNEVRGGGKGTPRILSVSQAGKVTEVQQLSEVDTRLGEGGLLGIAVSPNYATDLWVYIYYSAATDNRIARLHLGQPPEPIVTGIPVAERGGGAGARFHQGGRLAFGPDGMLYAGVGETYWDSGIAQEPASLGGKILRMTPDGKPAPGNPSPDSLVWTSGHRNVQGLAWDSTGRMYASEFGADTYDELNVIEPGRNYGWPVIEGFGTDPRYTNPIATWTPTDIASPSGIAIVGDRVYLACLSGRTLYRVDLDGRQPVKALTGYGRLRAVAPAPDGSLWILTSNRDSNGGDPTPDDDRILRLRLP